MIYICFFIDKVHFFNTLVENRTNKAGQSNVIINGEDSDLNKKDVLKGSKKKNNHANNDAKTH
jgi:hypothetical protein|tara:strand:+ start:230 stop:418 length:189 start_codon:yes stop_codon:yes gene_type:complete